MLAAGRISLHNTPSGISLLRTAEKGWVVQLDLLAALRRGLSGRYEVAGEIGRGGMAVVCRARDLLHDREVAIKVLYPDLARAVGGQRFLREIGILSSLSHPNILPLLDSGSAEIVAGLDVPWYAMPYVSEETLRGRLTREGALPLATAIRYTRDLCAALAHAHAQGVIHRDLKPENILLLDDRAVLADFGIARALTVAGGGSLSSTGIVVGTPAYMSPEQSVGSERLDARSDLYSLGVVLYEMLAGHPPFTASTPQAISARHQFEAPPPIGVVRPGLPAQLPAAIEKALAKVPADRYQSAEELATALERALAAPAPATTSGPPGRRWMAAAALLVAVAALAVALAPRLFHREKLDPSRYVVLPFQQRSRTDSTLVNGGDCEQLVSDILGRIPEHNLVSSLTVGGAVAGLDGPLTRARAFALARSYGAGRLVWGEIAGLSDTVIVTGVLYDVASGAEIHNASIRLPRSGNTIGALASEFAELTYRLVLPDTPTPETARDALGAKSYAAWRAYATGDSALNAWNLGLAKAKYREALTLDPEFPSANLKLAQVGEWLDDPAAEWRGFAERAVGSGDRLNPGDQAMASGLLALAMEQYPAACARFRGMAARDSLDFRGWFGLGECLTKDNVVLPDSASPTHWRYRTSYAAGIAAYRRGLTLVPTTHLAYSGAGLKRLMARLMTEPDMRRLGRTEGPTPAFFVAFPTIQSDTLAFVPSPSVEQVAGGAAPASWPAALDLNRRTLLSITSLWLSRFPESRAAVLAQAQALELVGRIDGPAGTPTALSLTRALRANAPADADIALAGREVRLLIKTRQFTTARVVAESALAVPPSSAEAGELQAGLAALIGRVTRAADLLGEHGETQFATSAGELVEPPRVVARDANRLLAFAGFGEPAESLKVIEARVRREVKELVDRRHQQVTLDAVLFQANLLGFPALSSPPSGEFPVARVEYQLARGHRQGARDVLEERARAHHPERVQYIAPDFALLTARLWAFAGDSAQAREGVERMLQSLGSLNTEFPAEVTQAASIGRAMRFYQALGLNGAASGIDSALTGLWHVGP